MAEGTRPDPGKHPGIGGRQPSAKKEEQDMNALREDHIRATIEAAPVLSRTPRRLATKDRRLANRDAIGVAGKITRRLNALTCQA